LDQARQYVNRVRGRVSDDTYGKGWTTYTQNEPTALATVGSEAEMLSLGNATKGDHIMRTDTKSTFVLIEDPAGNLENWLEYKDPNYKVGTYPAGHPAFS